MKEITNSIETTIWLILATLTGISWILAESYNPENPDLFKYVTLGLLVLAFFKVRLVIMHFMEVATAPTPLRLVFEIWVVVVCTSIIVSYLKPLF